MNENIELPKVTVLLSTYNGEKFLDEQLASISKQVDVDIKLLVRDDGSTDKTVDILERWRDKVSLEIVHGNNKGASSSFLEMIGSVDVGSDYYAFCDQDDYWYPEKLARAIEMLSKNDALAKPALYFSETNITDNKLNIIRISKRVKKPVLFGNTLVENVATGCTVVFNNQLLKLAQDNNVRDTEIVMHDWWMMMLAAAVGHVVYDESSFILYRQHENNEVGSKAGYTFWLNRFKRLFLRNDLEKLRKQVRHFYGVYNSRLTPVQKSLIEECFFRKRGITKALRCVGNDKLYRQSTLDTLLLRIILLFMKKA